MIKVEVLFSICASLFFSYTYYVFTLALTHSLNQACIHPHTYMYISIHTPILSVSVSLFLSLSLSHTHIHSTHSHTHTHTHKITRVSLFRIANKQREYCSLEGYKAIILVALFCTWYGIATACILYMVNLY